MRLFLAIYPPKEVLDVLRDVQRKYTKHKRNLKYTPVDQLHLTVRFIGPGVSETSKEQVIDAIRQTQGVNGPVEVNFKKIQFGFEKDSFAKYLIARIYSSQSLVDLTNLYHSSIRQLQLRDTVRWKEKHTENYHITLAKLKKTATKSTAKQIANTTKEIQMPEIPSFTAVESYLVESVVGISTVTYRKLERFEL